MLLPVTKRVGVGVWRLATSAEMRNEAILFHVSRCGCGGKMVALQHPTHGNLMQTFPLGSL